MVPSESVHVLARTALYVGALAIEIRDARRKEMYRNSMK